MGHGVKDCESIPLKDRMKEEDELTYSLALKAKSSMLGKECFQFGSASKRATKQQNYTSDNTVVNDHEEATAAGNLNSPVTNQPRNPGKK